VEEESVLTRTRTGIGYPLTPDLLKELEQWHGGPETPADFDPTGSWTQTYRIVTTAGFYENAYSNVGHLKITRTPRSTDETFTLRVDQEVVHAESVTHIFYAEITCKNDTFASPITWSLSSHFVGPDGERRANLDQNEIGRVEDGTVTIQINGVENVQKGQVTGDWCLFEAVQRLPFGSSGSLAFDLLEGMSIVRLGQKLSYRRHDGDLHSFHQLGSGALPYQYWLNDRHQLMIVVTGARAYLLDPEAKKRTAAQEEAGKRLYAIKKEYYAPKT